MHVTKKVLFFWRGSPSIGAYGLQKIKDMFFWKVSSSLGAFGAHGHVHVPTFGSVSDISVLKLTF